MFYDIIQGMKRYTFAILLLGLMGCVSHEPIEYDDVAVPCAGDCSDVLFDMPNGNDLVLETAHHIIKVVAEPNTDYAYYVWTGNKTYNDDPDIKIEQGDAYVLSEE